MISHATDVFTIINCMVWEKELFGCVSLQRISEDFGVKFKKKIEYFDSLQKYTQMEKQNQSNQSSDEGDIIDLKSTLF